MKSLKEMGYPLSLSRWTDVAHWYKPWLRDLILRQGFLFAPDPKSGLVEKWCLDPEEVLGLFFWTKNPAALSTPLLTWLAPYSVAVSITITGWEEAEPRVPEFSVQIAGLKDLCAILGPERIKVRYSPVPQDYCVNPARKTRLEALLSACYDVGVKNVELSLLHEKEYEYDPSRLSTLLAVSETFDDYGIGMRGCGEDLKEGLTSLTRTSCLNTAETFGVFTEESEPCGCSYSVDPCLGPKFGCGSGCTYCYAPYTKKGA